MHVIEAAGAAREMVSELQARIGLWIKPYVRHETHCSIVIAAGDVLQEISSAINKYRADLLIIGTHSATHLERLVLGSRAEELFRNASIPVLTIGPHVRTGAVDIFSSILFPTDMEPTSLRAAQYAVSIAEEANANLTMLHVLPKGESPDSHKGVSLRLQLLVPEDAALWCDPVFRTAAGDPSEVILDTAQSSHADLIVMAATHARLLADHAHWSMVSKIVRTAACPVLTIRDHL